MFLLRPTNPLCHAHTAKAWLVEVDSTTLEAVLVASAVVSATSHIRSASCAQALVAQALGKWTLRQISRSSMQQLMTSSMKRTCLSRVPQVRHVLLLHLLLPLFLRARPPLQRRFLQLCPLPLALPWQQRTAPLLVVPPLLLLSRTLRKSNDQTARLLSVLLQLIVVPSAPLRPLLQLPPPIGQAKAAMPPQRASFPLAACRSPNNLLLRRTAPPCRCRAAVSAVRGVQCSRGGRQKSGKKSLRGYCRMLEVSLVLRATTSPRRTSSMPILNDVHWRRACQATSAWP
jgi:hypothetical protein